MKPINFEADVLNGISSELSKNTHIGDTFLDKVKTWLEEKNYVSISVKADKVVGKRVVDSGFILYTYFYSFRQDRDPKTGELKDSGHCMIAYLTGKGMRSSGINNIEFTHIFSPELSDFNRVEELVDSLIILLR